MTWSKNAINGPGGQKTYITLRNLAVAYEKLNRIPLADSTMNEALLIATANQYTAYGRILITQKRNDKAMEVFTASQKRYGDVFGVNSGLVNGYSAKGDFKNAIKYAEKAMAQAPNDAVKKQLPSQIIEFALFDQYRGQTLAAGKKSLAFRVVMQDTESTLTDLQADEKVAAIVKVVSNELGASLR